MKVKDYVLAALFAAFTAVFAQISIPIGQVPISMGIFAVIVTGLILRPYYAFISMVIYILLGAVGIPVFAGFTGGISIILGPTGGFILSFPIVAFISSLASKYSVNIVIQFIVCALALLVCYLMGNTYFSIVTDIPFIKSLTFTVIPFIVFDLIKIVIAVLLSKEIRKRVKIS